MYASGLEKFRTELNALKTEVDLINFAVPIDNLLEPGVAEAPLIAFDQFIVDRTGSDLGFLYQDLNDNCILKVQSQNQQHKAKITQSPNTAFPHTASETSDREIRIE